MASFIVTIDGPAGVGKSTVARILAQRQGAVFLDTGATYRAVTLAAMRAGADLYDVAAVIQIMEQTRFDFMHERDVLKVLINGQDCTQDIRAPLVTENVRHIASQPKLRARLVKLQQAFASQFDKVVTEGRDQGTVVFPNARFKFFLTADAHERARRRYVELRAAGVKVEFDTIAGQIVQRDASDENRTVGPLKPAEDAILIDTTNINAQSVVNKIMEIIEGQNGVRKK